MKAKEFGSSVVKPVSSTLRLNRDKGTYLGTFLNSGKGVERLCPVFARVDPVFFVRVDHIRSVVKQFLNQVFCPHAFIH